MNDLITTTASLTTAFKNIYDISSSMLNIRKQRKLLTGWQLHMLNKAIIQAIEADRQASIHYLFEQGRRMLIETYKEIEKYANTPIGDMLLDSLRLEYRLFSNSCRDFDRMTNPYGYKWLH